MGDMVWTIQIEVSPFGEDANARELHQLGRVTRTFALPAMDMREAVNLAHAVVAGVKSNPNVGDVAVVSIIRDRADG